MIRRERLIQQHMESLRANPRRKDVDPDALRWTPSTTLNAVLSEEEREAEMDVGSREQWGFVYSCLKLLLLDVCLMSWRVQMEAINGKKDSHCQQASNVVQNCPKSVLYIIDSTEYSMKCNPSMVT